jgi:phosphate:Na+ symporter
MKRFRLLLARNTTRTGLMVATTLMLLVALPSFAATDDNQPIDWLTLLMGLFGGLAMFLYGMEQM